MNEIRKALDKIEAQARAIGGLRFLIEARGWYGRDFGRAKDLVLILKSLAITASELATLIESKPATYPADDTYTKKEATE